jgi:predicted O-methyltransferase YrrM
MNLADAIGGIDHHLWSSEPDVGLFLSCLVKMHRLQSVVEVGVFKGLTASYLIDSLGPGGRYTGIDMEDHRCASVKAYMEEKGQDFHLGDSKRELAKLGTTSADLIFLDGDHTLPYVKAEFLESLRVLRRNGFICIHDYQTRGVRLWVDYVKRFRSFDTMVFNTSENRGLAVIVPKRGADSAGPWFKLWFSMTRNDFMIRAHEKFQAVTRRHR